MFRISVSIDALDRNGRKVDGVTMSYKDFLTVKDILSKTGEEAERKVEVNLRETEQRELINELLKRPGVDNKIVLDCEYCSISGPANLIIVRNEEE